MDDRDNLQEVSVMAYVSLSMDKFYLSRTAMEQLKIIPPYFLQMGDAAAISQSEDPKHPAAACGCPTQQTPPSRPEELPFPPTQDNAPKMRKWLLDRYAASAFNTCPHQPLPDMTGPPLAIRMEAGVQPVVTNRPVRVPVHWREEVHQQLECDEALGVIEKVPPNTPVTWLHSMVVTPKSNGSPRCTVDLQPLNRVSARDAPHSALRQAGALCPKEPGENYDGCMEWLPFHHTPCGGPGQNYLPHRRGQV